MPKSVTLSRNGGDRATGYAMSNKIVCLPEGHLCTWIDSQCQNQWALVDRERGIPLQTGELGEPGVDNHCGAALAMVGNDVHAVTGAHHGPLRHYRFVRDGLQPYWEHVATLESDATYPALLADLQGRLHLAFRSPGEKWQLKVGCFEGGHWLPARTAVIADKAGYIYWTNGLALAPDNSLHLVFGNTRVLDHDAFYYGASHIYSEDGGNTWIDDEGDTLALPVSARDLPLITDEGDPQRIQSRSERERHQEPGPNNAAYQQMLLSNPVVDCRGVLHVIIHNGLTGTAELWSRSSAAWTSRALTSALTAGDAAYRIHMQSSLASGLSDQLHATVMLEPTEECVWGPNGTRLVRATINPQSGSITAEPIGTPDRSCAEWLPALAQQTVARADGNPPLLYTRGTNAGGFDNNINATATEVRLVL